MWHLYVESKWSVNIAANPANIPAQHLHWKLYSIVSVLRKKGMGHFFTEDGPSVLSPLMTIWIYSCE